MRQQDIQNTSLFFSSQSVLEDLPQLSQDNWARWENYKGPELRTAPTLSLGRKIKSLFGSKRRRISTHRAHSSRKAAWERSRPSPDTQPGKRSA